MRGSVMLFALAATLVCVGVARSDASDPMTTGSIVPQQSGVELYAEGERSVRGGFGFSPFMEEGLVRATPPTRHPDFQKATPAFERDFQGVADRP